MTDFILDIITVVEKSLIASVVLFALARLMGKKQISQLTFFDYTVGISIGSIAASTSVDQRIPLKNGLTSMIIWALLPVIFSVISVHSIKVRRMLDGSPTVLIQNGKIIEKNLLRSKFTVNDLLEQLRLKDVFNIADVEFAVLETSGKLSVLKTAAMQAATVTDLKLSTTNSGLSANVIIDGKFMKDNIRQAKIDEAWINNEMKINNINSIKDILLATYDSNKIIHFYKKGDSQNGLSVFQ